MDIGSLLLKNFIEALIGRAFDVAKGSAVGRALFAIPFGLLAFGLLVVNPIVGVLAFLALGCWLLRGR